VECEAKNASNTIIFAFRLANTFDAFLGILAPTCLYDKV